MLTSIKGIWRSLGPGFIIASVVLGPGSITVASRIGSEHGYAFLWVIVLAALSMIVYNGMSTRYGVRHQQSILQTIAEQYGRKFAIAIGISAFISASSFQFGNNLGIGIGMQGITGIPEWVWPLVFTALAIMLTFWAKNLYRILEKLMMVMVMIIILAFIFNLSLTQPNLAELGKGFLPLAFNRQQLDVVAALVATTFALQAALYQSYLVQAKGWGPNDLRQGIRDSNMGILLLGLISALVIITSAAALRPQGIVVNSAADMAIQLEALFGNTARVIFSLGLSAAAFSSLMVNAVIGGGLLSDSLGLGRTMNEKMPKLFTVLILLVGMIIAVFFRGNVVYALIMAQASTIFAVPLIALGLFLVLNNTRLMGELRNTFFQNILAIFGFVLISLMVYYLYSRLIGFLTAL